MPKKDLTEIVFIMDGSGSMELIRDDAISGFNAFIEGQREVPGEARFTLVLFNTEHMRRYDGVPLADVRPLGRHNYCPKGFTALLDSIGSTIDAVGVRLSNTKIEDLPEKVIVAILTDGNENASKEYTHSQILAKITEQREIWKWEFLFLAANQDAIKTGSAIGIDPDQAVNFAPTSDGTKLAFDTMSTRTAAFRRGN